VALPVLALALVLAVPSLMPLAVLLALPVLALALPSLIPVQLAV
jgi:hypothetical protein